MLWWLFKESLISISLKFCLKIKKVFLNHFIILFVLQADLYSEQKFIRHSIHNIINWKFMCSWLSILSIFFQLKWLEIPFDKCKYQGCNHYTKNNIQKPFLIFILLINGNISFLIKEVAYETKMLFSVNICMIYVV